MNFDLFDFVFIVFAALTVGAAISVLWTKDLARAAFFLAFCFIGVAATYIFLNAEFIGLIQILVYVGAINVLILFGIMITKTKLRGGGACE